MEGIINWDWTGGEVGLSYSLNKRSAGLLGNSRRWAFGIVADWRREDKVFLTNQWKQTARKEDVTLDAVSLFK